ncbi:MAG TPA: VWA domain-containing protein [Candidatus Sumerlaeota bacterium]|nr:VWA domain-containing protein [Candidatus Sumerlaeota bacterium]
MNFGNQIALYGLFGLPALVLFYVWVFHRKNNLLARMGELELIKRLLPTVSRAKQIAKAALLIFAISLLIFSLARPQYGSIERPITRKAVDIFIAIDTSISMMAQDIQPNRLARAKEQLKGLIHRLKGDRVGIITFAGTAFVQCPLTLDYALAQNILETINTDSVPVPGTAIGEAIRVATKSFEQSALGERVLVLLTDGEDHETDPLGAAQEAAKSAVKIYSIGIGSEKGEPIRLADGSFKQDSQGHVVNSRLDLILLQKIAQQTDGKTIKANPTGGLELDVLYADIGLIQKKTLRSQTYTIYEERFQYFLLPVILLLVIEMLMGDRRRLGTKRDARMLAALLMMLPFLFGFTLTDNLSRLNTLGNDSFREGKLDKALEYYKNAQVEAPESPELHFNIGNVHLRNKKYEEAIKEFEQAAALFRDPIRIADAHYNIGVAQYRMAEQMVAAQNLPDAAQKLVECMASNQQAMKKNAEDSDPKFNYEQAKRLWKELLDQMKNQQQEQEQKQQQNQEQQKEQQKENQEQQQQQGEQQNQDGQKSQEEKQQTAKEQEKKEEAEKQKEEEKQAQEQKAEEAKAEENKKDEPEKDEPEEGKEAQASQQQEAKIGEMSKEDALRLISTLPEENKEALKEALKRQYGGQRGTGKDW